MMNFKQFLETEQFREEKTDAKKSIRKLPKIHQELLKGFSFKFEVGNTLKQDNKSVGVLDTSSTKKSITIAAPWSYSREFALFHEIGHLIFNLIVKENKDILKRWKQVVNLAKKTVKQNEEESFSHLYANTYTKNKVEYLMNDKLEKFIKSL